MRALSFSEKTTRYNSVGGKFSSVHFSESSLSYVDHRSNWWIAVCPTCCSKLAGKNESKTEIQI